MDSTNERNATERSFSIVTALDVSKLANVVVASTMDEVARHPRSEVHFITVSNKDDAATVAMLHRHLTDVAIAQLRKLPKNLECRMKVHVRPGDPADEIINLVLEVEADLTVLGGTVSSGRHPHLSKVASRVIEAIPCPVLVARVPEYGPHPLRAKQCPDCVAVREASGGERWFCDAHSDRGSLTSSVLAPHVEPALGGGLLL